jgi:hypothetical protein
MPVMDVGVMRVGMCQPRVSVPMGMRFARRIAWRVFADYYRTTVLAEETDPTSCTT